MAKRKRKGDRKAQSVAALLQNGLKAFKEGSYTQAIDAWERAGEQIPERHPTAALAEAYFRQGMAQLYGRKPHPQNGLHNLQKAVESQPDDPIYTYHLGLAAHRQGDVETAVGAYQTAYQKSDELAERVAYPLALALQQTGKDPSNNPLWSHLSPEMQTVLTQASTFQRRPYTVPDDAPLIWQGLADLGNGRLR